MATTDGMAREALGELDARLDHWTRTLVELCRRHHRFRAALRRPPEGKAMRSAVHLYDALARLPRR